MESLGTLWQKLYDVVITFGPRLVGAVVTLVIGWWIVRIIQNALRRGFEKRDMDPALRGFLNSIIGVLLKVMLLISVIGMLGVQMTSFIAILGAAGLAVGMALSGSLQNFAGGIIILLFKPFKVGDFIEAQGHSGSVSEIQMFNTILKTPDNKTIILPNGALSSGSMINYSTESLRRVDFIFGIAYGDDVDKARAVLKKLVAEDTRIHQDPEPFVAVQELADSSVNLVVRVWAEAFDYWGIFFDMHEKVYKSFEKEGIHIPYPKMDIHVQK